ncbi:hypothetical protein [Limihaloglobus sulfuriphilus]|nr:hypothetical protein [Limihaloglobus sulfuriphilus]
MRKQLYIFVLLAIYILTASASDENSRRDYGFDGSISREVLHNYLSRSIHYLGMAVSSPEGPSPSFEDDLGVVLKAGAKYISRCSYAWDVPADDDAHFQIAKERAGIIHRADPEIMLQADIFETVYSAKAPEAGDRDFSKNGVENIKIPAFAFEEFDLEPEERTFRYEDMIYKDGLWRNRWCPGASVPDITSTETKMWVFYRAKKYIDAGYESIQLGQIQLFTAKDSDWRHMEDIINRIRRYGKEHARRNYVLISGHVSLESPHKIVKDGKILLDFLPFPLRLKSIPASPLHACLEMGYIDSVYDEKITGTHPSGWQCEDLPMVLEFDNYFNSLTNPGTIFPWGTDEITWFANQKEDYRNEFLKYAWDWLWKHDPNSYLSMPGRRVCRVPVYENENPITVSYYCNNPSPACPGGFGQEDVIAEIWSNPNYQDNFNRLVLHLEDGETSQGIRLGSLQEDMPVERLKLLYQAYGGFTPPQQRRKALRALREESWKEIEKIEQSQSYQREAELLRK